MSADCSFSSVLEASQQGWTASGGEDTLLSLALPLDGIDPLQALPVLADQASVSYTHLTLPTSYPV